MLKRLFTRSPQKAIRSRISIRTQLILATGLILVLASIIAFIGYLSNYNMQQVVQAHLQKANTISKLGFEIQNEFLLARQNEARLLTSWRTTGFDINAANQVTANGNHLAAARGFINQMEQDAKASSDPALQGLQSDISDLRPLLDSYENTFQSTVAVIRQRTQAGGPEEIMQTQIDVLDQATHALSNPKFQEQIMLAQANQNGYFDTGNQIYVDNIQAALNQFDSLVNSSTAKDFQGSNITAKDLKNASQTYRDALSNLVKYENQQKDNEAIFLAVTNKINLTTGNITLVSDTGLMHANEKLATIIQQSNRLLIYTAIAALILGVIAAVMLGGSILRPVNRLSQAAERMGQGNLSQPVEVTGSAELARLAETFNLMAAQMGQMLSGLEQRVAERTRDLERRSAQLQVAAEVAREATSIRELEELLTYAVNLIRDRFGFYHAGIFLIDTAGEFAVLEAATGEAGRAMLERNHKLRVGEVGLVGRVAKSGKPRISLDVGGDTAHLKNPLLPETRSEMALPFNVGEKVIGVLDVQSKEASAFDQEDTAVLQTLADQLAVAIDNARLLRESQENLRQIENLYGRYSQEAWEQTKRAQKVVGYQYDLSGVHPITRSSSADQESRGAPVSLPLKIRGQVIATLDVWPENNLWTAKEETLLNMIAERVGQAMESGRLFDEARARAANEQTISRLSAQFTRSVTFDTLLRTAVEELGRLPNVAEVSIHVGLPEAGAASPAADQSKDEN